MAEAPDTLTTMNGITKKVYGKLQDRIPKKGYFKKVLPLEQEDKIGDSFEEPIVLSNEGGVTYGGTAGDMYDLEESVAMSTQPASIVSNEYTLKAQMSYGAARRALSRSEKAFAKFSLLVVGNSTDTMHRVHETSYIWGQSATGIGQIAQSTISGSSTTRTVTFTNAQWAPYIWAGGEGRKLQGYDSNGTVVADSGNSTITLTKIIPGARQLLLTVTAGLGTALDTANSSGVVTFFWKGSKTNDMVGIDKQFSNTSGTIHGISADTYGQWAANVFPVSAGPLTFARLQACAGQLTNRGLDDEDLVTLVNPLTWVDLANEQSALRVYDESFTREMATQGIKALRYMSQNGWIQIVGTGYQKGGFAHIFPLSCLRRVGSSDAEMDIPGQDGGDFWTNVPGKNGAEARIYSDHAIYGNCPSACGVISGFTNTFGTNS